MPARKKLDPDEKRIRDIARAAAREKLKRERHRWYISLSCTGSWLNNGKYGRAAYRQYTWPKLFHTKEEAWAFAHKMNPFKNSDAIPGRGRIKSYTVNFKLLPEV